ncbi:ABC transporter permease [Puerhibacterium sp. TATVAM-FAB25]|uniref:ABC transporter permease n=1 Tax=Puerhibacterium sp. TATVAM-FAB25 TaxID=3093699 RepID=UPI00397D82C4
MSVPVLAAALPGWLGPTALGVGVLVAVTAAVLAVARVPGRWAPGLAVARGALQLAVVAVVLHGVIASPLWVAVALVVMFAVATTTSARRLGFSARTLGLVAAGMAAGAGVALAVVFATGALELTPRYALALGGIVTGGSMTAATLAGRRFRAAVGERWDEVEGWLALGARPRTATLGLGRAAVHETLVPTTDQTRTTGLVTLPGAFVGAIFGGVSPLEAGRFQVVVLAALLCATAVTAAVVVRGLGGVRTRPSEETSRR